jgi:hypothetical protein
MIFPLDNQIMIGYKGFKCLRELARQQTNLKTRGGKIMDIVFTIYIDGAVRDSVGKLIAYLDRSRALLHVTGYTGTFSAADDEQAADIIAAKLKF